MTMHTTVLALVCLACAGHGRRVTATTKQMQDASSQARFVPILRKLLGHGSPAAAMTPPGIFTADGRELAVNNLSALEDSSGSRWVALDRALFDKSHSEWVNKFLTTDMDADGAKGSAADSTEVVVPTASAAEIEDDKMLKGGLIKSRAPDSAGVDVPTPPAAEIEDDQMLKGGQIKGHAPDSAGVDVPTPPAAEIEDAQMLNGGLIKSRAPDWTAVVLPTPSAAEIEDWEKLMNRGNMAYQKHIMARRAALLSAIPLPLAAAMQPVEAFENRLTPTSPQPIKYKPSTPGPAPKDIGIQSPGTNALKPCNDGKPHCLSSSPEVFDNFSDADYGIPGWQVDPFKYDKSLAEALTDVKDAVAAYKPGQRGIDGRGFKLVSAETRGDVAYVYAQFQAMRKGYIDDMEFALSSGECNVRTSSRLGYTDAGVNAKRYEWFADALKSKGWKTTPLRRKGHESYFDANLLTDIDMTKSNV